jgi:hypothetical protein
LLVAICGPDRGANRPFLDHRFCPEKTVRLRAIEARNLSQILFANRPATGPALIEPGFSGCSLQKGSGDRARLDFVVPDRSARN